MLKILKYSLFDLSRSRWTLLYFLFFLATTWALLYLGFDLKKGIASLLNITLIIVPLVSVLFGVIQYYNGREFIELLLAQPVRRNDIFTGMYLGITGSLSASFLLGTGIPFLTFGLGHSPYIFNYCSLLLSGVFLTFIFSGLSFLIAAGFDNRLKGFGVAVLAWLFLAIIYDGLFLICLLVFAEYPVEKLAIFLSLLNPIDLCRILVMLQLDLSALLGYTGAVFHKFFGTQFGVMIAMSALAVWVVWPVASFLKLVSGKDF